MWLLSRLEVDTSRLQYSIWMAVLGAGIGMVMPVLVLAVQNSVRPADLGTATSANNYFRQIGGSVGAAIFGTLFADRLADALAERLPARAGAGLPDPESITPQLVHALPAPLRDGYIRAYADAMPRIFLYLVPVLVLGLLIAFFLKEKPLVSHNAAATEPVPASAPIPRTPATRRRPASPHAAGIPVCGTVQHPDGTVVPRAALTLIDVAGQQIGRGASGEDGRYALSTPGSGSYVLIAAAGGHQPQAVTVTVGERPVELDVVLGGAGRLAGSVLTADGTPVRDAAVTLTDVRGEVVATTRSGREGGYVITELVAGEYTLAASAPAFRPAALPVTVQASRETRQDVELAGGAVLRGTVRAGGGPARRGRARDAARRGGQRRGHPHHRPRRHVPVRRPVLRRVHGHRRGLPAGRHRAPGGRRRTHRAGSPAGPRGLTRPAPPAGHPWGRAPESTPVGPIPVLRAHRNRPSPYGGGGGADLAEPWEERAWAMDRGTEGRTLPAAGPVDDSAAVRHAAAGRIPLAVVVVDRDGPRLPLERGRAAAVRLRQGGGLGQPGGRPAAGLRRAPRGRRRTDPCPTTASRTYDELGPDLETSLDGRLSYPAAGPRPAHRARGDEPRRRPVVGVPAGRPRTRAAARARRRRGRPAPGPSGGYDDAVERIGPGFALHTDFPGADELATRLPEILPSMSVGARAPASSPRSSNWAIPSWSSASTTGCPSPPTGACPAAERKVAQAARRPAAAEGLPAHACVPDDAEATWSTRPYASGWSSSTRSAGASAPRSTSSQTIVEVSQAVVPRFTDVAGTYLREQVVAGEGFPDGRAGRRPPCGTAVALEHTDEPGRWDDVVPVGEAMPFPAHTPFFQCMTTGEPVLVPRISEEMGNAIASQFEKRDIRPAHQRPLHAGRAR